MLKLYPNESGFLIFKYFGVYSCILFKTVKERKRDYSEVTAVFFFKPLFVENILDNHIFELLI